MQVNTYQCTFAIPLLCRVVVTVVVVMLVLIVQGGDGNEVKVCLFGLHTLVLWQFSKCMHLIPYPTLLVG